MDRLKSMLALLSIMALFMTASAGAQSPFEGEMGPGMAGSPFGSPFGSPMGSPFGGMFPGMPFGMSGAVEQYRAPAMETSEKSLLATMESVPQLSLFTAALKETGYAEKLDGNGNYIVFAPPDKALQRDLAVRDVRSLLDDTQLARGLVENGVVLSSGEPDEHSRELALTAASGKKINVRKEKTGMAANGADVLKIFKAANGYVIVTDAAVGT